MDRSEGDGWSLLYMSVFDTNFHVQIIISNRLIAWVSGHGDHYQEQILTHLQT